MVEPGFDLPEWEALEPLVEDSPREARPELDDLLERMLTSRGFAPDDPVAASGDEPEVLANFRAAREITRLAEKGADLSPGDLAPAIEDYREVYRALVEQRAAP
jgi:hypothetical protein